VQRNFISIHRAINIRSLVIEVKKKVLLGSNILVFDIFESRSNFDYFCGLSGFVVVLYSLSPTSTLPLITTKIEYFAFNYVEVLIRIYHFAVSFNLFN